MTQRIENRTMDRLRIGDEAGLWRRIARADIGRVVSFAGDALEDAVDRELAATPAFRGLLSAGGTALTLILALIAARLPGPGSRITRLKLDIEDALRANDMARAHAQVMALEPDGRVTLGVHVAREDGVTVLSGEVEALAPESPVSRPFGRAVALDPEAAPDRLEALEARARDLPKVRMAVVNPVDEASLSGALESAEAGLITPVLIGPASAMQDAAGTAGRDLSGLETIECADAHSAAEMAAALAAEGGCGAIMKGKIHTDALLRAVLDRRDLHTDRRLSHVFVEDVPGFPRLLFVADGAVNIAPDIATLRDIVQNAIDLARALGIDCPRVALLSAVETLREDMPSTLAAAAICKMADRGEITGAEIDGPLALDNAVSEQAARIKGISSNVAGRADILIAPDIEAANILAKDLDHLAGAEAAGIALGARVPIALTSRADTPRERRASAALAAIMAAVGGGGPR